MIPEIRLLNVKGVTGTFRLTPITVVTGRNSVGKTAIINAIQLSLLGYVPGIGKQPSSTFTLSSGGRMAVAVGDSMWSWEQKKLKIQQSLPDGFTAAPETMLDLSGLFSLTKEQRVLAIMRACHLPESMGTVALVEKIRAVCPSFPFPATKGLVLEDIEALSKSGKTYQTAVKDRLAEYEAVAARHAQEMTAIPVETKSLEPDIAAASEKLGVAKQKLRQARDSEGERAKTLAKANAMIIPDLAALQVELEKLKADLASLPTGDLNAIEESHQKLKTPKSERLGSLRSKRSMLKERRDALNGVEECPTCGHPVTGHDHEKIVDAMEKLDEEGKALAAEINALDAQHAALRQSLTQALVKRQQIEKRIVAIAAQVASVPALEEAKRNLLATIQSLPAPEEEQALQADVDSLTAQIQALQLRQRHYQAAQSLLIAAELSAKNRKEHEARVDQIKLAMSLIADFRAEILAMVASTLLDVANRVIEPCLGSKLALEDGDFTLNNASMLTLSGSERMVVYAGLQIALSAAHKPKIVLMDELGVIDQERKAKLFRVLEQLIGDGTISQFVGVDINPLPTLPTVAGASLITL